MEWDSLITIVPMIAGAVWIVATLKGELKHVASRMDALTATQQDGNSRLSRIEGRFEGYAKCVDDLKGRVRRIESHIQNDNEDQQ